MRIPLNIIHTYIGFPVLLAVAVDSFRRYAKNKNRTTLFLAWACMLGSLATVSYGFPALFTDDSRTLSIFTLVGDYLFTSALLCLWIICIRAFYYKSVKNTQFRYGLVTALFLIILIEAVTRNISPPYSTSLVEQAGRYSIVYRDTVIFKILNGINSLALLFTGIVFWRQSKLAPDSGQSLRIRSMALGFGLIACSFIFTPLAPLDRQPLISAVLISSGLAIIGLVNIVGYLISRRSRATK